MAGRLPPPRYALTLPTFELVWRSRCSCGWESDPPQHRRRVAADMLAQHLAQRHSGGPRLGDAHS